MNSLPSKSIGSFLPPGTRILVALLSGMLSGQVSAQNSVVVTPVAEVGGTAPDAGGTWSALSTSYAAVGTDGGVTFQGLVSGLQGLWFGDPEALELAGLQGDPAPGTAVNYGSFTFDYSISPYAGFGLGFNNRLSDSNDGVWATPAGGPAELLALEGAVAPGAGGANFTIINRPSVNNNGDTLFRATVSAGGTRTMWRGPATGPVAYIARSTEAMNAVPGSNYSAFGDDYSINDNGTACFHATIAGAGIISTNNDVLLTLADPAPVAPTLVAREGNVAPGTGGLTFAPFTACHINDDDDVLFRAGLGGGALPERNTGVWFYDDSLTTITEVAIEGDAAPGVAGAFFHSFEELFLANGGVIALVAVVRDTANDTGSLIGRGVWMDAGAGLELVALVGEDALEKDGVTVHGVITAISHVTMNMDGDIAVEMTAGGVKGIWQREGVAAAATTQLLTVGDTAYDTNRQVRTVSAIYLPESEDFTSFGGGPFGRSRSLGEDAVPLLWINFIGSSGLYFADLQPLNTLVTSRNEEAPGALAGTLFDSIRPSGTVNDNGLVAMRAYLQDGTGDAVAGVSLEGIWAEESVGGVPQLTLVARAGDSTPTGDTYQSLPVNPIYNDNGSIAFPAQLDGGGSAFFAGPLGSLEEVAKTGELVGITGVPSGAVYDIVRSLFAYNNSGRLVTSCTFVRDEDEGITVNNDSAILRHGTGARVIAREGASVGAGAVGVFDQMLNRPVLINSTHRVAFIGNRKRNAALGITAANAAGVWYHNGTSLVRVAVGGTASNPQAAAGAGGAQFLSPTNLVFNDANRIAFRTTLQGTGVTVGQNDVALYSSNAGASPVLLVRTGSTQASGSGPAGVDPAATFASIGRPDIDAASKLVFRGGLTVGTGGVAVNDDTGIWANTGAGSTSLLLREGAAAPDSNGVATADVFDSFDDPVVGLDGRVVVSAAMRVGVGTIVGTNDRALFAQGSNGQFYRVAQEGQSVAIADGFGGTTNEQILDINYPNAAGGAGGSYKAVTSDGFVMAYVSFGNGATATMIFLAP